MNKRALVTVNYGNFLKDNPRKSMDAAAARWGVDYFEMNERTVPRWTDRAPNAMKTTIFRTSDYDEMIVLDGDVIVSGCCPNPFEAFPDPAELIAVADSSPESCRVSSWRKHVTKRPELDCPWNIKKYFNTGMFIVRRACHEEMLNFACDICGEDFGCAWSDQTPINMAALLKGVKIRLVDERWNYLLVYRFPDFVNIGRYADGPYILHGAGDPGREQWLHEVKWNGC